MVDLEPSGTEEIVAHLWFANTSSAIYSIPIFLGEEYFPHWPLPLSYGPQNCEEPRRIHVQLGGALCQADIIERPRGDIGGQKLTTMRFGSSALKHGRRGAR
jgi:hypothetical protein